MSFVGVFAVLAWFVSIFSTESIVALFLIDFVCNNNGYFLQQACKRLFRAMFSLRCSSMVRGLSSPFWRKIFTAFSTASLLFCTTGVGVFGKLGLWLWGVGDCNCKSAWGVGLSLGAGLSATWQGCTGAFCVVGICSPLTI